MLLDAGLTLTAGATGFDTGAPEAPEPPPQPTKAKTIKRNRAKTMPADRFNLECLITIRLARRNSSTRARLLLRNSTNGAIGRQGAEGRQVQTCTHIVKHRKSLKKRGVHRTSPSVTPIGKRRIFPSPRFPFSLPGGQSLLQSDGPAIVQGPIRSGKRAKRRPDQGTGGLNHRRP